MESTHRTALLITINACMFVFGVVLLLMGALLPALHVSNARAGGLGAFPLAGILVATAAIGPVLDRAGAKAALAGALAVIAIALAVMPLLANYAALAGAALAYGLGGGVLNTTTNSLIASLSASGRGAALNVLGFSFSLGAITAPLLMSSVGEGASPALVLRILALAALAVLAPVLLLHFPAPAHPHTPLRDLLRVLNQPLVWLFCALLFFESGNENCMFVWAAKVLAETLHAAAKRADLALLGLSAALGAGRLLAIFWLRWIGSRNTLLLSAVVTIIGALLALSHARFGWMLAGFVVIGLGMSAIFPTALGLTGDRFPYQMGTVFGAVMAVAMIGGILGPLAGGWAASAGASRVLIIPIAAPAMIAVLTLTVTRRSRKA
ncbi:MAG: MFS transporter [Terriglobia bacterium]